MSLGKSYFHSTSELFPISELLSFPLNKNLDYLIKDDLRSLLPEERLHATESYLQIRELSI